MFISTVRQHCVLVSANAQFATPEIHHVVLFVCGFAALASLAVLFHWHDLKQRNLRAQEMKTFAARIGFEYADTDRQLLKKLGNMSLFSWRLNRQIRNVIRKQSGDLDVLLFDYSYPRRTAGDETLINTQTVICFRLRGDALPAFRLEREGYVMSLQSLIGFRGIIFNDPLEFKYKYVLRGKDEAAIRTTFNEGVRQWLTAHDAIEIESSGDAIIFFRDAVTLADDKIAIRLTEACEVIELMIPSLASDARQLLSLASVRRCDGESKVESSC